MLSADIDGKISLSILEDCVSDFLRLRQLSSSHMHVSAVFDIAVLHAKAGSTWVFSGCRSEIIAWHYNNGMNAIIFVIILILVINNLLP